MNPVTKRRPSPWPLWVVALAAATVAAFLGITSVRIVHEAGLQEVHPADAIVVFGAAEYAGRPSPVFRARLDRRLHDRFHAAITWDVTSSAHAINLNSPAA